ncbi:MAG: hypothetical protein QOE67_379, partial [Solirubrobacteraceae bacterium]|nr:hypothetical protein [Solirubrobacteraceae bacterium]
HARIEQWRLQRSRERGQRASAEQAPQPSAEQ